MIEAAVSMIIIGFASVYMGWHLRLRNPPECTDRETFIIDALVLERNGPLITDVSESERESFAEDFECSHPGVDRGKL